MSWIKNNIKNCIFVITVTIFLLACIEGLAYFLYQGKVSGYGADDLNFRLSKPMAYKNSDYYSPRFVMDSYSSGTIFYTPENSRQILAKDYSSDQLNVRNGNRETFQTIGGKKKFYVFGGSTVYSGEVPDYLTIPSLIAVYLDKAKLNKDYDVVNKGITSVNTGQQLEYLKQTKINSGDTVIFYSGVNDILQSIYFGKPDGTIIGEQNKIRQSQKPVAWYETFYTFRLMLKYLTDNKTFDHIASTNVKDLAIEMTSKYEKNIIAARDYVENHGGNFFNFLQPNLFSQNKISKYERDLLGYRIPESIHESFYIGNKYLSNEITKLKSLGVKTFDLQNAFDNKGEECFLDGYHVTEFCNNIVAQKIVNNVFDINISILDRNDFRELQKKYYKTHNLEWLNIGYKPVETIDLLKISSFPDERLWGFGNRNDIVNGKMQNGLIAVTYTPKKDVQVDLDIYCTNDAKVTLYLNNENSLEKVSGTSRIPVVCGQSTTYKKLAYNPTAASLALEVSNGYMQIKSISIKEIKDN